MKTYNTLITVSGLRRADPLRAREPIGEGEVIALPGGYARSLLASGAIAPSEADVTVELDWDQPVELIKSNDPERLKAALEVLGMDFANGPDRTAVHVGVGGSGTGGIAPTDLHALAQALEAAGATVALPGEEFVVGLPKANTDALLAEVARRIGKGDIRAVDLSDEILGLAAILLLPPSGDVGGDGATSMSADAPAASPVIAPAATPPLASAAAPVATKAKAPARKRT